MKKILVAAAAMTATVSWGALWTYDFGTSTGSHTSGASETFLPAAPSGFDRVRVGTGGGGFYLENPGDAGVGSGSELRITAATGTSVNKLSVYDWADPTSQFSVSFQMKLTGGTNGNFMFFAGDGANFSDNNTFTGSQVFSGIQWEFGASGAITETYRSGSSWVTISGNPFSQNVAYGVEIYGNNATTGTTYGRNAVEYSLSSNQWDLWVNGTRIAGLNKAQLANGANIDSLMFFGQSSTSNASTIILDDFIYANQLPVIPEPGTLSVLGAFGFAMAVRMRRRKV